MKCLFGHKFGKVEGNFQYCIKCGKASHVKCNHELELITQINEYQWWVDLKKVTKKDAVKSISYHSRCKKCGFLFENKFPKEENQPLVHHSDGYMDYY